MTADRKTRLCLELLGRLEQQLDALESAYRASLEGATHEEAKPENDKDTRALEQSYLARGQATRVTELRTAVATFRGFRPRAFGAEAPAALGALVTFEDEAGTRSVVFLVPYSAAEPLDGGAVLAITPRSVLGAALVGARAGDEVEVNVAGRPRSYEVIAVV